MASKFDQLVADAIAHHKAGRLDQAEAAYRDALGYCSRPRRHHAQPRRGCRGPGQASFRHRLLRRCDRGRAAIRVGALQPRRGAAGARPIARSHPGVRARRARSSRGTTTPIARSDFCGSRRATGAARSTISRAPTSLGAARIGPASRPRRLTEATRDKLLHDAEQFRYLAERRRDRQRFEALARNYEEVAKGVPERSRAAVRPTARHAWRGLQHRDQHLRRAGACRPRGQRRGRIATP